jgi:small-conductance mechanosensitive channel
LSAHDQADFFFFRLDFLAAIFLISFLVLKIIKRVSVNRIRVLAAHTSLYIDNFLANLIDSTKIFFLAILSLSLSAEFLKLPAQSKHILHIIPVLALILQSAFWGNQIIDYLIHRYVDSLKKDEGRQRISLSMSGPLKVVALMLLWTFLILLALDNIGINITTLIAGLGIGGVAVALAVQNILGDLLAALTIVIDKPFVVGDFIILDNMMGTVEYIGMKTTRLRNIDGDVLIIPNSDLVKSRIRNTQPLHERRVVFQLGLSSRTTADQVAQLPEKIKQIVTQQKNTRFDRAHLTKIRLSSYDFEVVYYVTNANFMEYMDIQQNINLALLKQCETDGVCLSNPVTN